MRHLIPISLLFLLSAGCAGGTDEVLPISRSVIGSSRVAAVQLLVQPPAREAVAQLDERAARKSGDDMAGQPLAQLLPQAIADAAGRAGLTSGQALRLVIEIDALQTADAPSALFGKQDRLAGTVFIRDAETGAPLGQLYVDVVGTNSGLLSLATRAGVRERLVEEFADRIAKALSGSEQ